MAACFECHRQSEMIAKAYRSGSDADRGAEERDAVALGSRAGAAGSLLKGPPFQRARQALVGGPCRAANRSRRLRPKDSVVETRRGTPRVEDLSPPPRRTIVGRSHTSAQIARLSAKWQVKESDQPGQAHVSKASGQCLAAPARCDARLPRCLQDAPRRDYARSGLAARMPWNVRGDLFLTSLAAPVVWRRQCPARVSLQSWSIWPPGMMSSSL